MIVTETLPGPLDLLEDVMQDAQGPICAALTRLSGVPCRPSRTQALPLEVAEAARTFNRPTVAGRYTLEAESPSLKMETLVVLRERDALALSPTEGVRPLFEAVVGAVCEALQHLTRVPWRARAAADGGGGVGQLAQLHRSHLESVSCWVEAAGDAAREITLLFGQGAADSVARWESHVVVALRPELAEVGLGLAPGHGIDEAVLESIPVTVEASMLGAPVTVADLARLRVGGSLPLEAPWDRMVRLSVGGRVLACGELVVVGDHWGVLLNEVEVGC